MQLASDGAPNQCYHLRRREGHRRRRWRWRRGKQRDKERLTSLKAESKACSYEQARRWSQPSPP